jgi:carbon-monoxide dehydrogenase small subunit
MTAVTMDLNGITVTDDVPPRQSLADFLRDRCSLTATHLGCEHGACGACTVLVDGQATRSCLALAGAVDADLTLRLRNDPPMGAGAH